MNPANSCQATHRKRGTAGEVVEPVGMQCLKRNSAQVVPFLQDDSLVLKKGNMQQKKLTCTKYIPSTSKFIRVCYVSFPTSRSKSKASEPGRASILYPTPLCCSCQACFCRQNCGIPAFHWENPLQSLLQKFTKKYDEHIEHMPKNLCFQERTPIFLERIIVHDSNLRERCSVTAKTPQKKGMGHTLERKTFSLLMYIDTLQTFRFIVWINGRT